MEQSQISMIIKKAIIHILDSTVGMPVLSDAELEFGPDLSDFFKIHIAKILNSDDIKSCQFSEDSEILKYINSYDEENFVPFTKALATELFQIMYENPDIPPADLAILIINIEGIDYLALLKLNYRSQYTHLTAGQEQQNRNEMILQKAILPSQTQRLTEAMLINLEDCSIRLLEKKYEMNGSKTNYLSQRYLKCHAPLSQKAKLHLVTKAVEQVNQKHYGNNDVEHHMEVKNIIYQELEETGNIRVETVKEKVFKDNEEMKQEFEEKLEKYHLQNDEVKPQNKQTTKKFEKQHLMTDTGIEITIPMGEYNNKEKIQFITNPDGTVSILINHIGNLTSK